MNHTSAHPLPMPTPNLKQDFKQHDESANHYWLAQIFFWGSYCVLNLLIIGLGFSLSAALIIIFIMLSTLLGFSSHGLRWLYRCKGHSHSLSYTFLHLLWLIPLMALTIQSLLAAIIYGIVNQSSSFAEGVQPLNIGNFLLYIANTSIMLIVWSIVYLLRAEFFKRRHAEVKHWRLHAELKTRELDFLRSQINSHFLFNAINNLRTLVREDAERARSGLADLSILLRGILHSDGRSLIKLHEELEWVRGYLSLEALQFENRLSVEEHIDPELLHVQVPPLLLQTLVENAIKHGIAARRNGGTITVTAQRLGSSRWQLSVNNPQPEFSPDHSGHGVGLKNVRERLRHAFGNEAEINLNKTDDICVRVVMPL